MFARVFLLIDLYKLQFRKLNYYDGGAARPPSISLTPEIRTHFTIACLQELSILDYKMLRHRPSVIAAAAILMVQVRHCLNTILNGIWE